MKPATSCFEIPQSSGIASMNSWLTRLLVFRLPVSRTVNAYNFVTDEEQSGTARLVVRLFPRCGGWFVAQWVAQ